MKARAVDGLEAGLPLRRAAARILRARLDELRSFAPRALDRDAAEAQHDMRIAAKRLRYVLEVVGGCFGEEAREAEAAAKALQGALGEVHDCDVMLARAAGIESLVAVLQTRRELRFGEFRELWRAQERAGAWAALARATTT